MLNFLSIQNRNLSRVLCLTFRSISVSLCCALQSLKLKFGTMAEPEEFYDVEKILKFRIHNNARQFFIKWLGYDTGENTWEPEENLDCSKLLEEFEKKRNGKVLGIHVVVVLVFQKMYDI